MLFVIHFLKYLGKGEQSERWNTHSCDLITLFTHFKTNNKSIGICKVLRCQELFKKSQFGESNEMIPQISINDERSLYSSLWEQPVAQLFDSRLQVIGLSVFQTRKTRRHFENSRTLGVSICARKVFAGNRNRKDDTTHRDTLLAQRQQQSL